MGKRASAYAVAMVAILCTTVSGQGSKWYDPYEKGVKAVDAGKYQEAVAQLERAVAADPRSGARKYVEGVHREDYFPYYYLAIAYTKLGDLEKAQQNLDKARNEKMPAALVTRLNAAGDELSTLRSNAARRMAPPTTEKPAPPARNAAFDAALSQADLLVTAKQYEAALRQFDTIKSQHPADYAKENLQTRRDAAASAQARDLADDGIRLAFSGQLNQAKAKLQHANQIMPGQKAVTDALAHIRKQEDEYQRLKAGAAEDVRNKNLPAARQKYELARQAHPEQFTADNLPAQMTLLSDQAEVARRSDESDRQNKEASAALDRSRLAALQAEAAQFAKGRNAPQPDKPALREALVALLQGDAAKSVAILESLLGRRPAGGDKNAHVHAYLGVAYATQALSAPKPEDQARLREKAIDQFHLTVSTERDYRLSERLVSPKIRALFDLAHR